MNQKKAIIITFVILIFITFFMVVDTGNKKGGNNGFVSPNILYITQPVNSFSGTVEKIEGNSIFVSNRYSLPQTAPIMITVLPGTPPVMPTPKVVTTTYQAVVTDKTQINQPAPYVNYLFKTITPAPLAKLTIKDIKVGQYVTVGSQSDLRTLEGAIFEATMINLPQKMNTLNGRIIEVNGDTLVFKALQPTNMTPLATGTAPVPPKEKEFTVTVTSDTEISHLVYSASTTPPVPLPPKSEKLAVSDLKVDMQATIFTDMDVTANTKVTALRIEPMISVPAPEVITPTQAIPISAAPVVNVTVVPTP